MQIILARHGNTFANDDKVVWVGSDEDMPLTSDGRRQAEALGRLLNATAIKPKDIYCGPLVRTRSYAEILRLMLDIENAPIIDKRLREISYGAWGGLSNAEIAEKFGSTELTSWNETGAWPWSAGWSPEPEQILENVKTIMTWIAENYDQNDSVVLVTSNGILRFIRKYMIEQRDCDVDSLNGKVSTGNFCEVYYDKMGFKVLSWNKAPC